MTSQVRRTANVEAAERAGGFEFAVRDAVDDRFLGACGANNVLSEHCMCNLGYWIRTGETGRGAASAATRLVARFAIEQAHLNRVEIVVAVGNAASLRVAERAGAKREGILRDRLVARGRAHDAVMFSILESDLESP